MFPFLKKVMPHFILSFNKKLLTFYNLFKNATTCFSMFKIKKRRLHVPSLKETKYQYKGSSNLADNLLAV